MKPKIFYRERLKIGEKDKKPRFMLVAIAGVNMKVYAKHLRENELKQIAKSVGAQLVLLKRGKKDKNEKEVEVDN